VPDLRDATSVVIERCLGVSAGESVLVVGDRASHELARALYAGALAAGADPLLATMEERASHGAEPPAPLAAALAACDVFIAPTTKSLSHTVARKQASEAGARGATLPGATAEMLARVMAVDLDALRARSRRLAALLAEATEARVRCARGTDLRLDLSGRSGVADDGDLTQSGAFGNLPCGEGFIAPLGTDGSSPPRSLGSACRAALSPSLSRTVH